jgi:beta-phosphoglucomutase-like phosphatase (HAD superfamily)
MDILIFDMDGVLLEARGYHRALQETVRLAGEHLGQDDILLTQGQIHKFESLGISSEWHSSALCTAFLKIQLLSGTDSPSLDLQELFAAIQDQPLRLPAGKRGLAAIKRICEQRGVEADSLQTMITESENIDLSLTMNWFQELILGSEAYQARYQKPAQFNTLSYLEMYDIPLLSRENADRISNWSGASFRGAAIMTNRPSSGPAGFSGSPEAEMGLELVQLAGSPLIGYGDISWLAESIQSEPGTLNKPHYTHALAAIFASIGITKEESLTSSIMEFSEWDHHILDTLQGKSIAVFEDTPAGLESVRSADEILRKAGIIVRIKTIGIAAEETKKAALEPLAAQVFPDINSALSSLDGFRPFSRN